MSSTECLYTVLNLERMRADGAFVSLSLFSGLAVLRLCMINGWLGVCRTCYAVLCCCATTCAVPRTSYLVSCLVLSCPVCPVLSAALRLRKASLKFEVGNLKFEDRAPAKRERDVLSSAATSCHCTAIVQHKHHHQPARHTSQCQRLRAPTARFLRFRAQCASHHGTYILQPTDPSTPLVLSFLMSCPTFYSIQQ